MKSFLEGFLSVLRQKTPEGINTVDMLIAITPMSREAAYRRLRGEIEFSFGEIIRIAQKLDISLDGLVRAKDNQSYRVKVSYIRENSFMEDFIKWQEMAYTLMKDLRMRPEHYALSVNNHIPILYLFKYDLISKLRMYKWMYQRSNLHKPMKFSEFALEPKAIHLQQMMWKELCQTRIHFIYGQELMKSLVNDINYFRHLNLVNDDEVSIMKEESFSVLKDMEHDAILGKNNQMPCTIHETNVNIGNDFIFWNNDIFSKVTFRLFGVNFFTIDDPEAINEMKNWTNMLLKSSTQISFSGEKRRMEFFQQQRKMLEQIYSNT